jgi:catechol 1,2-dioxygenase/hydroxyquinol 1,2-dioxygenase
MRLSREGEADKTSGRVGSDPSAIFKAAAREETAAPAAS